MKPSRRLLIELIILIGVLAYWGMQPGNITKAGKYFMKAKLYNKPYCVVTLNSNGKIGGKIIKEDYNSVALMAEFGEVIINKLDIKNIETGAPASK